MKTENQLLARIARVLTGAKPEVEAVAEVDVVTQAVVAAQTVETIVEAGVEATSHVATLHVDTTEMQTVIAGLEAQVELVRSEFATQLVAAAESLALMTSQFEAAQAELATLAAEKAAMEVAAGITKMNARKVLVEAAIGTEKAAGFLLATEGLDDAAFDNVVAALAGSVDAEAKSTLFQEVGATGVVDAAKIVTESAEMQALKQKYPDAK